MVVLIFLRARRITLALVQFHHHASVRLVKPVYSAFLRGKDRTCPGTGPKCKEGCRVRFLYGQ